MSKIVVYSKTIAYVSFLQNENVNISNYEATSSGTCNVGDDVDQLTIYVNNISREIANKYASASVYNIPPGLVNTKDVTETNIVYPN